MKFKDKKNEATGVASSRKGGQIAQDKMTKEVELMVDLLGVALGDNFIQLEVEPKGVKITPETIIGMIDKKDKKKLN